MCFCILDFCLENGFLDFCLENGFLHSGFLFRKGLFGFLFRKWVSAFWISVLKMGFWILDVCLENGFSKNCSQNYKHTKTLCKVIKNTEIKKKIFFSVANLGFWMFEIFFNISFLLWQELFSLACALTGLHM